MIDLGASDAEGGVHLLGSSLEVREHLGGPVVHLVSRLGVIFSYLRLIDSD